MKSAPTARSNKSAPEQRKFYTDNPRHSRVLNLLIQRPATREELDARAGCSNSPELVADLRRRGLELPCQRVDALDRDGRHCRPGVYFLSRTDRRKLAQWMRTRGQAGCIAVGLANWLVVSGLVAVAFCVMA